MKGSSCKVVTDYKNDDTYPLLHLLCPYLWYPQLEHYWPTSTHTLHPSISQLFSIFPTVYPMSYQPSTVTWLNYPPNYLGPNWPSTNICYPSALSYNDCGHHQSLPHATSHFRLIGSHDHCVLQLTLSRSPSSFSLNRSFPIW